MNVLLRSIAGFFVCLQEFMYAVRKHTAAKILPICMEPQMLDPASWEGPIGMELGST